MQGMHFHANQMAHEPIHRRASVIDPSIKEEADFFMKRGRTTLFKK